MPMTKEECKVAKDKVKNLKKLKETTTKELINAVKDGKLEPEKVQQLATDADKMDAEAQELEKKMDEDKC